MKLNELKQIIREEIRRVLKEDVYEETEANAELFIENPALKSYITDKDQYGFAIMEVPVAKLEAAMKMKIKDILTKYDKEYLSISVDPTTETVDIILDRTNEN